MDYVLLEGGKNDSDMLGGPEVNACFGVEVEVNFIADYCWLVVKMIRCYLSVCLEGRDVK